MVVYAKVVAIPETIQGTPITQVSRSEQADYATRRLQNVLRHLKGSWIIDIKPITHESGHINYFLIIYSDRERRKERRRLYKV